MSNKWNTLDELFDRSPLERAVVHDGNPAAAAELADIRARLETMERERDALRNVLKRYVIYEEFGGYEKLSEMYGACEHPESSVWMTEWLERVLRGPASAALKVTK